MGVNAADNIAGAVLENMSPTSIDSSAETWSPLPFPLWFLCLRGECSFRRTARS